MKAKTIQIIITIIAAIADILVSSRNKNKGGKKK